MAPGQKTRQLRNLAHAQDQCSKRSAGTSSATSVRKVRGINKGKGLDRLIKKIGGKPIKLNISVERRPVGENNELLSREIGIITRYHAPIQRIGWQNMTEVDKEALHTLLKKRSTIGKDNRSNLPYMHWKGTKSFVALQHELGCGDITLYKECYSNDKGWASSDAREKHDQMVRMQEESMQQDEIPLTEPQICEKVLGKAYGYIRGRGHGPKPNRRATSTSTRTYQQMEEELASTKQTVAVQQNQLAVQQNQLESQQKQLDWLHSVVSKLAGIPTPCMDANGTSVPAYTATTSNDGSGSLVSDGISRRSCT